MIEVEFCRGGPICGRRLFLNADRPPGDYRIPFRVGNPAKYHKPPEPGEQIKREPLGVYVYRLAGRRPSDGVALYVFDHWRID